MKRNLFPGSRRTRKGLPRVRKERRILEEESNELHVLTPKLDDLRERVARIRLQDEFTHQYVRKCHVCGNQKKEVYRTKHEKSGKVIVRKVRGCGCKPHSETLEITRDMALLARAVAMELGYRVEHDDPQLLRMCQRLVKYLTFSV